MNTNVDGKTKIAYAMTQIKGVGRRYAILMCKKADVPTSKRAGELSEDEINRLVAIMQNPLQYKIPEWLLNRQKCRVTGRYSQKLGNEIDGIMREDYEKNEKDEISQSYSSRVGT